MVAEAIHVTHMRLVLHWTRREDTNVLANQDTQEMDSAVYVRE